MKRLRDYIKPRAFISYSRKQQLLAEKLSTELNLSDSSCWIDIDEITIGSDWAKEIETGIFNSDEVILILTKDSLKSEVVKQEIYLAEKYNRTILAYIERDCVDLVPTAIQKYQYAVFNAEEAKLSPYKPAISRSWQEFHKAADIKLASSRSIFPPFDFQLLQISDRNYLKVCNNTLSFSNNFSESSSVQLNTGLILCMQNRFTEGIKYLMSYARAADNLAGWYFLATHFAARKTIRGLPNRDIKQINEFINRAKILGKHPFVDLLEAFISVDGLNQSRDFLSASIANLLRSGEKFQEDASEFQRFFWTQRKNIDLLGEEKSELISYFKSRAKRDE